MRRGCGWARHACSRADSRRDFVYILLVCCSRINTSPILATLALPSNVRRSAGERRQNRPQSRKTQRAELTCTFGHHKPARRSSGLSDSVGSPKAAHGLKLLGWPGSHSVTSSVGANVFAIGGWTLCSIKQVGDASHLCHLMRCNVFLNRSLNHPSKSLVRAAEEWPEQLVSRPPA